MMSKRPTDAEEELSGIAFAVFIALGAAAAVSAFGIGYVLQSWWLA